jgi:ribosomal protein S12 methylthiotransferase accessory factor
VQAVRAGLRAQNGGKGLTPLDAEVGALCEAAERFSGTWQGDERHVRGSLRSLGTSAIDPRDCMLFDDRQYRERSAWNPGHSPFNQVPDVFEPDAEIDWTPLWSLSQQRFRLLPTALLYFGAPPVPSLRVDSNGCAAGSSLEDAVLQGLLELVERDAVAIWWYNRLRAAEVDLEAFGPALGEQRRLHASIGRVLHVLDVSSDLGVPVMAAVSARTGSSDERVLLGFGAHPDPRTALRRAVSEVNQMLGADRCDPATTDDPDWIRWAAHATLGGQPYLQPSRDERPRGPEHYAQVRGCDIAEEVGKLVRTLSAQGMDTLVLDQTRPDVAIPVVRVVVPGLRSFFARFAPGRLFEVPVRTGARTRPTDYEDLNPFPFFL